MLIGIIFQFGKSEARYAFNDFSSCSCIVCLVIFVALVVEYLRRYSRDDPRPKRQGVRAECAPSMKILLRALEFIVVCLFIR